MVELSFFSCSMNAFDASDAAALAFDISCGKDPMHISWTDMIER